MEMLENMGEPFRFPDECLPGILATQLKIPCWGFSIVRAPGIEPGLTAWKAVILPLNYARDVNQSSIYSLLHKTKASDASEAFVLKKFRVAEVTCCHPDRPGHPASYRPSSADHPDYRRRCIESLL
jgi:hypothetical protein